MKVDRVIVSVNDNPAYYEIWPLTAASWKKFFPEYQLTLGLVSSVPRPELIEKLGGDTEVLQFLAVPGIDIVNQSRVLRHYLAAQYLGEIIMVHDVDSVILDRDFLVGRLRIADQNNFFALGRDVMNNGKFPMGYSSAASELWKRVIGSPSSWEEFIRNQSNLHVFDRKEAINQKPIDSHGGFCDESWLRARLSMSGIEPCHVTFGKSNWSRILCSRHAIPSIGDITTGKWIEAHHLIPWQSHRSHIDAIQHAFNWSIL